MSVSKVQRTQSVTAASIYAVYGTRRNMKRGEVRAALVTYEARGAETVLDFAQQVRRDVHGARTKRSNEALVLVQSWHPDVLNKNDEFDVDLAHSAGVELARGLVEHSDFMVATHKSAPSRIRTRDQPGRNRML